VSHKFACTFIRETDAAVLVTDEGTGEQILLPLSQVDEMHRDRNGRGTIVVSDWIAREKGLA
jgi:hypothetical protein